MPRSSPRLSLSRRQVLRMGGVLAATAVTACEVPASDHPMPPASATGVVTVASTAIPTQVSAPTVPLEVIAHNRLAFGPRPGDLESFRALPGQPSDQLSAYLEAQLSPASIDDAECDARLKAASFVSLGQSLQQVWEQHIAKIPFDQNDERYYRWNELPLVETIQATFLRAVYSRRQLLEVLVDFWHNHFNVYGWHESYSPVFMVYDRDVIRANALGNFRQALEAVAASPAMLFYLDNYTSQAAGPNENFAREMLELHTLGAENYLGVADQRTVPGCTQGAPVGYVDNDIYEAARSFTGWRVNDNLYDDGTDAKNDGTFLYYKPWHDRFNKFVLGRYLPPDQADQQDGRAVLDLAAFHPGTARHIARKLCRRLIGDAPSDSIVQAAADVFTRQRDAPDQLKQVVRAIVLSDEFKTTWGTKIKRPFEAAISTLRALKVDFPAPTDTFLGYHNAIGQPLFGHHAPNGYPDVREAWSTTVSLLNRWRFVSALVEGSIADDKVTLAVDLRAQMPAALTGPAQIVDFWLDRLLGRPLASTENRTALIHFLAGTGDLSAPLPGDTLATRLPGLVELILMAPEFQLR